MAAFVSKTCHSFYVIRNVQVFLIDRSPIDPRAYFGDIGDLLFYFVHIGFILNLYV